MAALFRPLPAAAPLHHRAMQPELERDDQVVARVVAWHNRHPLATRITADQVHSVGVVSLPYAVQGAEVQPAAPLPPASAPPDLTAYLPAEAAAEAAVELAIEGVDEVDAPPAFQPAAESGRPPVALPTASDRPAQTSVAPSAAAVLPPRDPIVATLPTRPRSWHPLTWWRRRRAGEPFHALFSEDLIEPLRARRVARWVAAQGIGRLPLAADAPRRLVEVDPTRRRAGDPAPEVELHVITAAIGIGDQRRRLLLAPGERGAILGHRHWSRPRLATAGALLAALLVPAAALPWLQRSGHAPATAAMPAAVPVLAAASSPASAPAGPLDVSEPSQDQPAEAPAVATAAAPEAPAAAPPPDAPPRRGRIELDPLVPRLADGERQQLRRHGRELRAGTAPPAEAKAWALVTAPLDQRRAERAAAQLQAVALFQPGPMRVERMPAGTRWRAVFWPFTSVQDAEKVRLALADKGLQTELLEF